MLKLRRAVVASSDPLEVDLEGERRRAWADPALVGECLPGDEVVVNVAAVDLGLGSGGFDIVHVNLSRGLEGGQTPEGAHVIKLNYTSLQHPVDPVELPLEGKDDDAPPERPPMPVLVLPLHGHLAPAAWAVAAAIEARGCKKPLGEGTNAASGPSGNHEPPRVGFIQTAGAALSGTLSRDLAELRERGLICDLITVAPCFGGAHEAISTVGALDATARGLGWDAAIVGPGPGILGSASRYGHGGMAALDSAHAALALALPTLISPRLSSGDPRPRHRGLSHHSASVLELMLKPASVAAPEGEAPEGLLEACGGRHRVIAAAADRDGYLASGLPRRTMGRDIDEDPLFFAAPLAAGAALAGLLG